eukprot:TRINITY_DN600_c0_g1_i7.p5 TRINITY_DN600_c0_g1~~TRINITY_DN600_c0_g1_i7.p5  ORF type:complete len:116 (-),score=25.04 TRINITY_DN600_c0_g1_i7:69-416(-)
MANVQQYLRPQYWLHLFKHLFTEKAKSEYLSFGKRRERQQQVPNISFYCEIFKNPMYSALIPCLLYTSDAADEEDSVDLGGRRIIKKKKKKKAYKKECKKKVREEKNEQRKCDAI